MPDLSDDTSISSFEDLDPEPRERLGLTHAREFLLGLALILAVLIWSGYRWVDDQRLLGIYHSAQQAETTQNLDRALVLYRSIPGYKDSNTKAAQMARTISDRDLSYRQATIATDKKDWPAAYQAAKRVSQVDADFRDIRALLDQAEKQVYSQALSGTVALRTGGNKPGLYYRTEDGWFWLRGSDQSSRVQGLGPSGHLVYDIPSAAGSAGPGYGSRGDSSGANTSLRPPQRTLMLATIKGSAITFCQLAMNPLDYSYFIWGEKGVWGLHYNFGYLPSDTWSLRDEYSGYAIDYQAYNSSRIDRIIMPDGTWLIMDFAPGGDAMLVAAPVYYGGGVYSNVDVYLAGPDGRNLRSIYHGMQGIRSAHFSPDGRYVLLSTYRPTNDFRYVNQSVILIDLKSGKQWTLGERDAGASTGGTYPTLGATFLTEGKLAGKILLFQWEPDSKLYSTSTAGSIFSLVDPEKPNISMAEAETNGYPPGPIWVSEGQGGRCLLVAWQNGVDDALPYAPTVTVLKLEPGRPGLVQNYNLEAGETLTGAWLRDSGMLFTTQTPTRDGTGSSILSIRSVKLSNPSSTAVGQRPVPLYSGTVSRPPDFSYTAPMSAGSELLAYVDKGQLHARSYDGTTDLSLEMGIVGLYNFPYRAIHWLK